MPISSRTPEGFPNVCPICRTLIVIEPSRPFGDAPCPACGTLLWYFNSGEELRVFDAESPVIRNRLAERLGNRARALEPAQLQDLEMDSLEVVDLVMSLEVDSK